MLGTANAPIYGNGSNFERMVEKTAGVGTAAFIKADVTMGRLESRIDDLRSIASEDDQTSAMQLKLLETISKQLGDIRSTEDGSREEQKTALLKLQVLQQELISVTDSTTRELLQEQITVLKEGLQKKTSFKESLKAGAATKAPDIGRAMGLFFADSPLLAMMAAGAGNKIGKFLSRKSGAAKSTKSNIAKELYKAQLESDVKPKAVGKTGTGDVAKIISKELIESKDPLPVKIVQLEETRRESARDSLRKETQIHRAKKKEEKKSGILGAAGMFAAKLLGKFGKILGLLSGIAGGIATLLGKMRIPGISTSNKLTPIGNETLPPNDKSAKAKKPSIFKKFAAGLGKIGAKRLAMAPLAAAAGPIGGLALLGTTLYDVASLTSDLMKDTNADKTMPAAQMPTKINNAKRTIEKSNSLKEATAAAASPINNSTTEGQVNVNTVAPTTIVNKSTTNRVDAPLSNVETSFRTSTLAAGI